MSLKSPYTTQIERGGYTAIVHKDGDNYIAKDAVGNIIKEGTDAATIVQKAIDDYAQYGLVIVEPTIVLTTALKINKSYSNVEFFGDINSSGVNAIELGDTTHQADGSTIKLARITGINNTGHGIVFKNAAFVRIDFRIIKECLIGMYFDACAGGGARECILNGGHILECDTAGVRFSSATDNMEGNHFTMGITHCPIGFETNSAGSCSYQTFIGVIDNVNKAGSVDIKDPRGSQWFLLDFVRREKSTIGENTFLTNVHGNYREQSFLENRKGSADFVNIGFTPMLIWDFNRDSTADWSKSGCTMGTPSKSVTRITASDADPYIYRVLNVDGGETQLIIMRYKYISGTESDAMSVFYKTSSHDFSSSYVKASHGLITDGEWHILVLDMAELSTGGTDWIDNIITEIRFDYTDVQAVYDIDYIAIGTRGYGSSYHMDDALKTPATAGAVGNKGDIRWDSGYVYICTATNTWKRAAITTW